MRRSSRRFDDTKSVNIAIRVDVCKIWNICFFFRNIGSERAESSALQRRHTTDTRTQRKTDYTKSCCFLCAACICMRMLKPARAQKKEKGCRKKRFQLKSLASERDESFSYKLQLFIVIQFFANLIYKFKFRWKS